MMKLFKSSNEIFLEVRDQIFEVPMDWDALINLEYLPAYLTELSKIRQPVGNNSFLGNLMLSVPIGTQEVWAAGVTYSRSKVARMEESEKSGGDFFYDKVYDAERPELFFKANAHRVVPSKSFVRIRKDSTWNVPEPELTLVVNNRKEIVGYTIGNDMSSRSIEGENPLYLPQAKVYDGSAAIGPCILVKEETPISPDTEISIEILRDEKSVFQGTALISQMKRSHDELVQFLYRECSFPSGAYLMTGTCLVPEKGFTLSSGDEIIIQIDGIGILQNLVH